MHYCAGVQWKTVILHCSGQRRNVVASVNECWSLFVWRSDEVCLSQVCALLPLYTLSSAMSIIIVFYVESSSSSIKSFPTSNSSSQCSCLGVRSFKHIDVLSEKFLSLRSSKFNYVYTNYCSIATGHCPIYKYVCVAPYCHSPTIIDFGVSACVLSSNWPYLDVCIWNTYPTPAKTLSAHHWTIN